MVYIVVLAEERAWSAVVFLSAYPAGDGGHGSDQRHGAENGVDRFHAPMTMNA